MERFNVEDAFFGAILSAWLGVNWYISDLSTWEGITFLILLVLLFTWFGTTLRIVSGTYKLSSKIWVTFSFVPYSAWLLFGLYWILLNALKDSKKIEMKGRFGFFASVFGIWVIISFMKIILYYIEQWYRKRHTNGNT